MMALSVNIYERMDPIRNLDSEQDEMFSEAMQLSVNAKKVVILNLNASYNLS